MATTCTERKNQNIGWKFHANHYCLMLDMNSASQTAKLAVGRRLDGRVGRHAAIVKP